MMKESGKFFKNFVGFPFNHGITTQKAGDFGFSGQSPEEECNQNIRVAHVMEKNAFVKVIPEHKDRIEIRDYLGMFGNYFKGDGFIWQDPGNGLDPILMSTTADCPVITIRARNLWGIVHSGRKGTELGIVPKAIDILKNRYEIPAPEIYCGVWPGICQECYELEEKLAVEFPVPFVKKGGKVKLDLGGVVRQQLLDKDVPSENISTMAEYCSAHSIEDKDFLFYSYRREGTLKRNVVYISK